MQRGLFRYDVTACETKVCSFIRKPISFESGTESLMDNCLFVVVDVDDG